MSAVKSLPLLLNLAYMGFNRALPNPDGSRGDFQPIQNPDGSWTTYCNEFILYILNGLGYGAMNGMLANQMVQFMTFAGNGWISPNDDATAQAQANAGGIVLAGRANFSGHGHVCLVLPGILEKSGNAGKAVPKVVNVGKDVFFGKRLSYAFSYPAEAPTYFSLISTI